MTSPDLLRIDEATGLPSGMTPDQFKALAPADLARTVGAITAHYSAKAVGDALEELRAKNPLAGTTIQLATQHDPTKEAAEQRVRMNKFFRGALRPELRGENWDGLCRDLNTVTGSEGGYLVPTAVLPDVQVPLKVESEFEKLCLKHPMGEKNLNVPKLTTFPSAVWRNRTGNNGEGGLLTKSNPAFDQTALTSHPVDLYSAISKELIYDSSADIVPLMSALLSLAIRQAKQYAFAVGDNDGMPRGIAASDAGYTAIDLSAVGGTFNYTGIVRFMYGLPTPYHANATWVMTSAAIAKFAGVISTTGQPIFTQSPGEIWPRVGGRRVVELPDLASTKAWLGDWMMGYQIGERNGIEIEPNTQSDTAYLRNQVLIKGTCRVDGEPNLTDAVRVFTGI